MGCSGVCAIDVCLVFNLDVLFCLLCSVVVILRLLCV